MKCYKWGCMPVESGRTFYPIDPKGKNRRWVCESCMTDEQKSNIPQDVKGLVNMIQTEGGGETE